MKTLTPITVGNYAINVSVEQAGGSRLAIVATYGTEKLRHIVNHKGPHDMSAADFEVSITKQINMVANELARKIHSIDLVRAFATPVDTPKRAIDLEGT